MAAFGLPNFGQLTEAFRKAQQIQQDAQKLQEELEALELEGNSKNGKVSVWLSGNQEPVRVQIEPSLLTEGQEATEQAILEALQAAYENSTTTMKTKMEELTGGLNLNLPGMNDEN
ncbi:YbaB/EbfC family nucleoid-associated protein [Prochlorococcus sp. MIT 1307]|uniref:YbaB/EbfC family nucleoid-associated protein n=1 Tax=Prochlorococcus sp. MIT 1307 TaxID=3096219 RepID=UPI002A75612B|nr:YbaB/EbfC family nucleoid-associated protein [Prochlorococcus sp. MIT 1307]